MDQQQRYGDGGDIMGAADLQDVSQAHDGWIPRRDVPWTYVIIHAQVEDNVNLRQVRVPRDVKFTFNERKGKSSVTMWRCQELHYVNVYECIISNYSLLILWPLPGEMLDGFLSTALLLSSPPFLEISVKKKNGCKKTKNSTVHNLKYRVFLATTVEIFYPAFILPTWHSPACSLNRFCLGFWILLFRFGHQHPNDHTLDVERKKKATLIWTSYHM